MNLYCHAASPTSRPIVMFAGELGLEAEFQGFSDQFVTHSEERCSTGKLVEAGRHPAIGLVVRAIAACALVAVLVALLGGAIELALVL